MTFPLVVGSGRVTQTVDPVEVEDPVEAQVDPVDGEVDPVEGEVDPVEEGEETARGEDLVDVVDPAKEGMEEEVEEVPVEVFCEFYD